MLALAGLDGSYERIEADQDVLSRKVADLRAGEWHGLNVTMPLKEAAAALSDHLSPSAERSRSVNTLLLEGERVAGHSTDTIAFKSLLDSARFASLGSVLVIGAGATAAAAMAAIDGERRVYVGARRRKRAEELTATFGGEVVAWGAAVAGSLVINVTPIGMRGEMLPPGVLAASAGLIDLPYGESPTPAVASARKEGLAHADGHEFLIRQAIESFHLWTGTEIDYSELLVTLRNV
jgi:shikimate dehydrogenase